jgi:hypothetical protein
VDIEMFRLPQAQPAATAQPKAHRVRRTETFLAGGAPMWWLRRALELGKAALATGVALWFAHGLQKGGQGQIRVNAATRGQMGLSNDIARRGIHALARGGLINVVRGGRGRCTVIEIVTERTIRMEPRSGVQGEK